MTDNLGESELFAELLAECHKPASAAAHPSPFPLTSRDAGAGTPVASQAMVNASSSSIERLPGPDFDFEPPTPSVSMYAEESRTRGQGSLPLPMPPPAACPPSNSESKLAQEIDKLRAELAAARISHEEDLDRSRTDHMQVRVHGQKLGLQLCIMYWRTGRCAGEGQCNYDHVSKEDCETRIMDRDMKEWEERQAAQNAQLANEIGADVSVRSWASAANYPTVRTFKPELQGDNSMASVGDQVSVSAGEHRAPMDLSDTIDALAAVSAVGTTSAIGTSPSMATELGTLISVHSSSSGGSEGSGQKRPAMTPATDGFTTEEAQLQSLLSGEAAPLTTPPKKIKDDAYVTALNAASEMRAASVTRNERAETLFLEAAEMAKAAMSQPSPMSTTEHPITHVPPNVQCEVCPQVLLSKRSVGNVDPTARVWVSDMHSPGSTIQTLGSSHFGLADPATGVSTGGYVQTDPELLGYSLPGSTSASVSTAVDFTMADGQQGSIARDMVEAEDAVAAVKDVEKATNSGLIGGDRPESSDNQLDDTYRIPRVSSHTSRNSSIDEEFMSLTLEQRAAFNARLRWIWNTCPYGEYKFQRDDTQKPLPRGWYRNECFVYVGPDPVVRGGLVDTTIDERIPSSRRQEHNRLCATIFMGPSMPKRGRGRRGNRDPETNAVRLDRRMRTAGHSFRAAKLGLLGLLDFKANHRFSPSALERVNVEIREARLNVERKRLEAIGFARYRGGTKWVFHNDEDLAEYANESADVMKELNTIEEVSDTEEMPDWNEVRDQTNELIQAADAFGLERGSHEICSDSGNPYFDESFEPDWADPDEYGGASEVVSDPLTGATDFSYTNIQVEAVDRVASDPSEYRGERVTAGEPDTVRPTTRSEHAPSEGKVNLPLHVLNQRKEALRVLMERKAERMAKVAVPLATLIAAHLPSVGSAMSYKEESTAESSWTSWGTTILLVVMGIFLVYDKVVPSSVKGWCQRVAAAARSRPPQPINNPMMHEEEIRTPMTSTPLLPPPPPPLPVHMAAAAKRQRSHSLDPSTDVDWDPDIEEKKKEYHRVVTLLDREKAELRSVQDDHKNLLLHNEDLHERCVQVQTTLDEKMEKLKMISVQCDTLEHECSQLRVDRDGRLEDLRRISEQYQAASARMSAVEGWPVIRAPPTPEFDAVQARAKASANKTPLTETRWLRYVVKSEKDNLHLPGCPGLDLAKKEIVWLKGCPRCIKAKGVHFIGDS